MLKNNLLYVFVCMHVFYLQSAFGMDMPLQSLYQYFNLKDFEHAPKDVKNLVVKQVVGFGG